MNHNMHRSKRQCRNCNLIYCAECNSSCPCCIILIGSTGMTGNTGLTGATGLMGQPGTSVSFTGATGLQGNTGLDGSPGLQGSQGLSGCTGLQGATGMTTIGPMGATGMMGVNSRFGSVYTITEQTVAPNGFIIFDPSTAPFSDITQSIVPSGLMIPITGDYEAIFTVTNINGGRFGLYDTPVASSPFILPHSTFSNTSNEIVGNVQFTANSGDIISLINNGNTSSSTITQSLILFTYGHNINTIILSKTLTSSTIIGFPPGYTNSIYVIITAPAVTLIVNDNLGSTYNLIDIFNTSLGNIYAYYVDNVTTGINFQVTVTITSMALPGSFSFEVVALLNTSTPSFQSFNTNTGSSSTVSVQLNPLIDQMMLMGAVCFPRTGVYTDGSLTILDTDNEASRGIEFGVASAIATISGPQNATVNYSNANITTQIGIVIGYDDNTGLYTGIQRIGLASLSIKSL